MAPPLPLLLRPFILKSVSFHCVHIISHSTAEKDIVLSLARLSAPARRSIDRLRSFSHVSAQMAFLAAATRPRYCRKPGCSLPAKAGVSAHTGRLFSLCDKH